VKRLTLALFAFALAASAQVSGTIVNGATARPQPNQKVSLFKFGQGGMVPVDSVQTDAQGAFSFAQAPAGGGPTMVRAEMDGINYNKIIPPGTPSIGFNLIVYPASKSPGDAKVSKHMLLFQPGSDAMVVNETLLVDNPGKTAWVDPKAGTVRFYLAPGAKDLDAKATAPDGMPVPAPESEVGGNVHALKFEIKPGQTRFDLSYTVPYKPGDAFEGKIATKDENTYLIVPDGVTMQAEHTNDLGTEPRTKAHIYGLDGNSYKIVLTGAVAAASDSSAEQANNGPRIEEILPRILNNSVTILILIFAILGLAFAILYRKEAR
jgi:hypothetical protein